MIQIFNNFNFAGKLRILTFCVVFLISFAIAMSTLATKITAANLPKLPISLVIQQQQPLCIDKLHSLPDDPASLTSKFLANKLNSTISCLVDTSNQVNDIRDKVTKIEEYNLDKRLAAIELEISFALKLLGAILFPILLLVIERILTLMRIPTERSNAK